MIPQAVSPPWDDEIDLRQCIDVLLRHRWLILAITLEAVAAAGFVSYVILPPTYEATAVILLPGSAGTGLGLNPQGYYQLAVSNRVMPALRAGLGLDLSAQEMQDRFQRKLDAANRLLTVTASAHTADEAFRLATRWFEVFSAQSVTFAQEQLQGNRAGAERALGAAQARLTQAQELLVAHDQEVSPGLLRAHLDALHGQLVEGEGRLRELLSSLIPHHEAKAAFLAEARAAEAAGVALPAPSAAAAARAQLPSGAGGGRLSPLYLQLSQELALTHAELAAFQGEFAALITHLPALQKHADELAAQLAARLAQRERLLQGLDEAARAYGAARAELDRWVSLEQRLPDLVSPKVVNEPHFAERPVAPRKVLNMALAGMLALFCAVMLAFFREFLQAPRPSEPHGSAGQPLPIGRRRMVCF